MKQFFKQLKLCAKEAVGLVYDTLIQFSKMEEALVKTLCLTSKEDQRLVARVVYSIPFRYRKIFCLHTARCIKLGHSSKSAMGLAIEKVDKLIESKSPEKGDK